MFARTQLYLHVLALGFHAMNDILDPVLQKFYSSSSSHSSSVLKVPITFHLTAQNCILQIQCKNQVMFVCHVLQSLRPASSSPSACSRPTSPHPCVPASPRSRIPASPRPRNPTSPRHRVPASPHPWVPRPTSQSPSPHPTFSHSLTEKCVQECIVTAALPWS